MFGITPGIFPIDFVLREDGASIFRFLSKATAIWHSVPLAEEEEGECGLYSGIAIFQENTADNDRRLPNRVHKSGTE